MQRMVIIDGEPILRMDLASMLEELGYEIAGEAGDGFDALEVCRAQRPDVVLMDVKMPIFDGLTAAERVLNEDLCRCVILLTAFNDADIIERAKEIGVSGYLVKPVEQRLLKPTIEVSLAQSERLRSSRKETEQAKQKLADVRLIAQAQVILAEQNHISESEVYQVLQKLSMHKRTSMTALAQALIEQSRISDDVAFIKEQIMREKKLSASVAERKLAEYAQQWHCTVGEAAKRLRYRKGGVT